MRSGTSWGTRVVVAGVACALVAGTVGASGRSDSDSESVASRLGALEERANQAMGLLASDVVFVSLTAEPAEAFSVVVPVGGELLTLDMRPHSTRSDQYQLIVQHPDGSRESVEPGPVRTLRGVVREIEGATVAGSLLEEGLLARITLPDGEEYWVEPLAPRVFEASREHYVVYRGADVIQGRGVCGAAEAAQYQQQRGDALPSTAAACGGQFCLAEFAAAADVEYFEDHGSVAAVEAQIASVIDVVNAQYERDVEITHTIKQVIVHTAEPDPYNATDPNALLNEFRNEWQANNQGIGYDMAELFTGKNINGGVIGIAWLNAVCGSLRYSVVQSDFNNNFTCTTDLSAHEMGHNWGADHCTCSGWTMNPSITCANQFHANFTIPEIISFRDSRTCLDPTGGCLIPADCDDGNPCTDEDCVAQICQFTNNTALCDDGDLCTESDVCGGGVCAGTPLVCNDFDDCTVDTCSGGVCSFDPINCDDGNVCTDDTCVGGVCQNTNNTASCDDGDPCTEFDVCGGGSCAGSPLDCDDLDPCTNDSCNGGTCQNVPIDCDDGNQCTLDGCVGGVCTNTQTTDPCDDGDPCTEEDVCEAGTCAGRVIDCDDGSACTDDACVNGVCENTAIQGDCDDGDPCTLGDTCASGNCVGTPLDCDDGNLCTDDSCVQGQCVNANNTLPCFADLCFPNAVCSNGVCDPGEALDCDDGNPCTADTCHPTFGCQNEVTNGACDDGDECTQNDTCVDGVCVGDPSGCDDGDACTTNDTCTDGVCVGTDPVNCDDGNPCTEDSCDPIAGCRNVEIGQGPCDDGNACTVDDTCSGGSCGGTPVDCDDGNDCTDDSCDPQAGCRNTNNSRPCNDGSVCTVDDACAGGACGGTPNIYGDVNRDGQVDLFDILCELNAFQGDFTDCGIADADIAECGASGAVDLPDILAVLDAFQGIDPCCGG